MELLVLVPSLFIFLYCLYKLIKDDYIFIRKNVSTEQAFDAAFLIFFVGLLFAHFSYFLFHPQGGQNIFVSFFTGKSMAFSFVGGVVGSLIALYLLCKFKKMPLGRLADFFTMAFLAAMPLGFALNALLHKKIQFLLGMFNAAIYFLLALFFFSFLYPKLMQRTMKEGTLSLLFLLFFSLTSFGGSLLVASPKVVPWMDPQNWVLFALFLLSLILLIKQRIGKVRK